MRKRLRSRQRLTAPSRSPSQAPTTSGRGASARSRSPRRSTTARTVPRRTACSASGSSAPNATTSARAASTRARSTRASSATAAASRSPTPRPPQAHGPHQPRRPRRAHLVLQGAAEPPRHAAGNMKTADLEKVIYFQDYVVTDPGNTELEYKQVLTEDDYRAASRSTAARLHAPSDGRRRRPRTAPRARPPTSRARVRTA